MTCEYKGCIWKAVMTINARHGKAVNVCTVHAGDTIMELYENDSDKFVVVIIKKL